MKQLIRRGLKLRSIYSVLLMLFAAASVISCAGADPRNVDVELKQTAPAAKVTSFSQALGDLGLMTEIYGTSVLKIQSNPIGDNTGSSASTGYEIPRDITEIMKSSLNSIGGRVVFIPYDPSFIQNQMVTGYSGFEDKIIPDIILTGGITEFDRGLVTKGENTDVSGGAELRGLPGYLPSKEVEFKYGDQSKEGLARITLDFNLVDFRTMSGVPKMNTVNSMEVHKALAEKELGVSLFGQSFGLKGAVKKVEGRHAAVRLLVELSMIQIVGKHLVLPYWRLLGEDALPDKVVLDAISKYYYRLMDHEAIASVQEWLYLYGYDIPVNGSMDTATMVALQQVTKNMNLNANKVDLDTFLTVYTNIPVDQQSLGRREMLARLNEQPENSAAADDSAPVQAAAEEVGSAPAQEEAPAAESRPKGKASSGKKKKIGRLLNEDEW